MLNVDYYDDERRLENRFISFQSRSYLSILNSHSGRSTCTKQACLLYPDYAIQILYANNHLSSG